MRYFVLFCFFAVQLCAAEADPFFGMDGALSWLMRSKAKAVHRERLIRQLHENHVSCVRERLMWKELNPRPEIFKIPANYLEVREQCHKYGLTVLDIYHDAPKWITSGNNPYPANLPAARDAWRKIADRLQKDWCGWEIWNEPDIGFGGYLPFDQYHVLMKTINLAAEGRPVPLVGMVSATALPGNFSRQASLANAFELVDAVSFHSYNSSLMMAEEIAAHQKLMDKVRRPLWITESGYSFPIVRGKNPEPKALHASAWHITLKTVVAKAAGVERIFPFVYCNYHEGVFSFSLLDPKYQPYPALRAYFAATRMLYGKKYIGDLPLSGVLYAPVFAGANGERIAVVIAADPEKPLPALPAAERIYDLYGQPSERPAGFAWIKNPKVRTVRDTKLQKMVEWAENARKNHRTAASKLIIQPCPDMKQFEKVNTDGYHLQQNGTDYVIPVRVWNLGKTVRDIELTATDNAGHSMSWKGEKSAAPDFYTEIMMRLPLNKWIGKRDELLITLMASAKGEKTDSTVLRFLPHRTVRITIPGKVQSKPIPIAEWHSMGGILKGKSDLSAEFRVEWTPEKLTFRIDVTDDAHVQSYPPEQLWMGDSLQLALCVHPGVKGKTTQYALGISDKTGKAFCYADRKLPGVNPGSPAYSVTRQGAHTKYILTVAPENINVPAFVSGMKLGVSIFVNDHDGEGRKGGYAWGDGIARYNGDPAYYYEMILK